MRCKVIQKTICLTRNDVNPLEKGEFVHIEKKLKDGNEIVKVYQDKFLGILFDDFEDCLEEE